jgi:hypothetical protein
MNPLVLFNGYLQFLNLQFLPVFWVFYLIKTVFRKNKCKKTYLSINNFTLFFKKIVHNTNFYLPLSKIKRPFLVYI